MKRIAVKDFERFCYHWNNGAYINGFDYDFDYDMKKLILQYGYPDKIARSSLNDMMEIEYET